MINWQVIGQLLSTFLVFTAGPAVILFIAFNKGNL